MKPQSGAFLEKSAELLDRADAMLRVGLNEDAGRTAYMAGFHAAQAPIFETHGRVFKSHSGVHGEFSRLTKDDKRFDSEVRAFLGRAYNLKAIADYEIGSSANLGKAQAAEAASAARSFVTHVTRVLKQTE